MIVSAYENWITHRRVCHVQRWLSWSKAHDWKSCVRLITDREFESLPLREKRKRTKRFSFFFHAKRAERIHCKIQTTQTTKKNDTNFANQNISRRLMFWLEFRISPYNRFRISPYNKSEENQKVLFLFSRKEGRKKSLQNSSRTNDTDKRHDILWRFRISPYNKSEENQKVLFLFSRKEGRENSPQNSSLTNDKEEKCKTLFFFLYWRNPLFLL